MQDILVLSDNVLPIPYISFNGTHFLQDDKNDGLIALQKPNSFYYYYVNQQKSPKNLATTTFVCLFHRFIFLCYNSSVFVA